MLPGVCFDPRELREQLTSSWCPTGRGDRQEDPYPVEEGERVPGVGISKCEDTEHLAEPGLVELQKPKSGKKGNERGVSELHTHAHSKHPRASHQQGKQFAQLPPAAFPWAWRDLRGIHLLASEKQWSQGRARRSPANSKLPNCPRAFWKNSAHQAGQLWGSGPGGAHLQRGSCLTGQSPPGDDPVGALAAQLGV